MVLLCLFFIPSYIFRFDLFSLPTNALEVIIAATALIFLIERLVIAKDKKITFGFWYYYLLILFATLGVYISADRISSLGILKGWFLIPAVFYILVINIFNKENIRTISIPLFISLLIVSLLAALQKLGVITTMFYQVGDPGFFDYIENNRAFGPFESPNYLAMFIVPVGLLSLPIFEYFKKAIDKTLVGVLFILPLFALYSTKSLGGLLALGFGIISFFAFGLAKTYRAKVANSGKQIAIWVFAVIVGAAGFAYIFSNISKDTYSRNVRVEIYNYAIDLVKTHPIFGIGTGQFQSQVEKISSSNAGFQMYGLSYALHPHNLYLAFWLNLGIFGFLAFIYILISFFINLGRRGGDILLLSGAFAAMVAIMIHGLVDTTYFKNDLSVIFWLILAVGTICGKKDVAK